MPVDETWGLLLRLLTAMQPKTHRFGTDGTARGEPLSVKAHTSTTPWDLNWRRKVL